MFKTVRKKLCERSFLFPRKVAMRTLLLIRVDYPIYFRVYFLTINMNVHLYPILSNKRFTYFTVPF